MNIYLAGRILNLIEDDMRQTYLDIMNGKNYKEYLLDEMEANYEFMKLVNETNNNEYYNVEEQMRFDYNRFELIRDSIKERFDIEFMQN